MLFLFTAACAVGPSLLLIWYFYTSDVHREPKRPLWGTFGRGVLAVVPVLLIAGPLNAFFVDHIVGPYRRSLGEAFLLAAIPEELFKFEVLRRYVLRHRAFNEPMDGIVYGAVASLGFATLENVCYTIHGGLGTALLRAVTAVPGHAFLGAIMGYYVGQWRFGDPSARRANLTRALVWPIVLHGVYDAPLMAMTNLEEAGRRELGELLLLSLLTLSVLLLEWIWAIRVVRRLRREQESTVIAPA
jgi:RsiW-degrading membrane proteinase PrsW (M82 family)